MNQISINTIPAIQTGISKKITEISWLSDVVARDKNSDHKNTRFGKDFKKKK